MPRRTRLGLTAGLLLALALDSSAAVLPPAGYVSTYVMHADNPAFGGLSGIEISDDGSRFTALSDRSHFVTGTIRRDDEGQIVEVTLGPVSQLRGRGEMPLAPGRDDSEGLAIALDGTIYVSLEGVPRVLRYRRLDGPAENLPSPPEFARMPRNGALEALAVDATGRLYTMPEETRSATGFPVWRFDKGRWSPVFDLPRDGAFLPVGADFGPDGRLYILERQFHGIAGFSSRVRALTLSEAGPPKAIDTVMQSPTGLHDNLEGISVWKDTLGRLRLTLVADDNFMPWQRSEIVEYALPSAPEAIPAG